MLTSAQKEEGPRRLRVQGVMTLQDGVLMPYAGINGDFVRTEQTVNGQRVYQKVNKPTTAMWCAEISHEEDDEGELCWCVGPSEAVGSAGVWAYVPCEGVSFDELEKRAWSVFSYASNSWEQQLDARVWAVQDRAQSESEGEAPDEYSNDDFEGLEDDEDEGNYHSNSDSHSDEGSKSIAWNQDGVGGGDVDVDEDSGERSDQRLHSDVSDDSMSETVQPSHGQERARGYKGHVDEEDMALIRDLNDDSSEFAGDGKCYSKDEDAVARSSRMPSTQAVAAGLPQSNSLSLSLSVCLSVRLSLSLSLSLLSFCLFRGKKEMVDGIKTITRVNATTKSWQGIMAMIIP